MYRWGVSHGKNVIEMYHKSAAPVHKELSITLCGLFVDMKSPYIGASPDAIINCKCCGTGVLEIKCPYTFKSGIPELLPMIVS